MSLSDRLLNAASGNDAALHVRLAALRPLLEASGEVAHYEIYWLRDRIEKTCLALGE